MNLHWSPLLPPPLKGTSHVSTLQILALCQLLTFYHILPLCSSSRSFNYQVPRNGPPFSAITKSFFLPLKLYGTEEHLPPTHLAVYSRCWFCVPLFLPLQCNISVTIFDHLPRANDQKCLTLRVTYYRFFQGFWDFYPTSPYE